MYDNTHVLDTLKVNSYVASMDHDIFIDESIEDEVYYRSVISTLNKASDRDTIRFIISSNGGFGSTAMMLAHAMDSCPAHKIGILSGNVKSAATIIALHCNSWEVGEGCDWLAHTGSFGIGGEAPKVAKQHEHQQKLIRNLLFREYEGFYTQEEIEDIALGNDSLLLKEEVMGRLENFSKYRQNKQKSSMEDMFEEQNSQMDKYQNILLGMAIKEGKLTQQEVDIALKVQNVTEGLDETISDEELEALMKQEDVEKKDDTSELKVVTVMDTEAEDWYLNCDLLLWYGDDMIGENDFAINLLSKQDIEYCNVFWQDEDDSSHTLEGFARGFGIKFSHNISDDKLHQKIIDFFQEKWDNQNKV